MLKIYFCAYDKPAFIQNTFKIVIKNFFFFDWMSLNNKSLPSLLHQLLFNHWLRTSNKKKGNQRDGLWLARMNLATHSYRSNTVGF